MIPAIKLNNGVEMPQLGLGTWKMSEGGEALNAVKDAIGLGYRLIDTAKLYANEDSVGEAIRQSGVPREEIFVTTKLWNDSHGYDAALRAFDASLERLGLDYIDLYLIHWPGEDDGNIDAWRALEKLYADKRVRAIGVSNFEPSHLNKFLPVANVLPAINQVQLNPFMQQRAVREYCARHDIQVESYTPLMKAGVLLDNQLLADLAVKYGKTPAQIVLRWHVQSGLVPIPKSSNAMRQRENFNIFDFKLSDEDMQRIDELGE